MGLDTMLNPAEAAKMGETILAERQRLADENEALKEKVAKLEERLGGMVEKYKELKVFEPLLEDAPQILQVCIKNAKIVRMLQARALKAYGPKFGAHPDSIDKENVELRRRARMNYDTILEAVLHHGLFNAWNVIYMRYIKPNKL